MDGMISAGVVSKPLETHLEKWIGLIKSNTLEDLKFRFISRMRCNNRPGVAIML